MLLTFVCVQMRWNDAKPGKAHEHSLCMLRKNSTYKINTIKILIVKIKYVRAGARTDGFFFQSGNEKWILFSIWSFHEREKQQRVAVTACNF